jgi:uncharacterized protein
MATMRRRIASTIAIVALQACSPKEDDHIHCPIGPDPAVLRGALRTERPACERGDVRACVGVGIITLQGPLADPPVAVRALRRACDGGQAHGCHWLSVAYRHGLGVKQDESRSVQLERRACELGSADDCSSVGNARRSADANEAGAFLEKSCKLGNSSDCVLAASIIVASTDDNVAAARAQRIASTACRLADQSACVEAKRIAEIARKIATYAESASACEGGNGGECLRAGRGYMHHSPLRHAIRATKLLQRGCDLGSSMSCIDLASHYALGLGAPQDPTKAHEIRLQYCNSNVPAACEALGDEYATSLSTKRNMRRALDYYLRSCDLGGAHGCVSAASLVEREAEFGWNRNRALELYERGCKLDKGMCGSVTELRGRLDRP